MKYNTKKIVNGAQIFLYGFCMNRPNICNPNKTWTTPKIPSAKNNTPTSLRIDCLSNPYSDH